MSRAKVFKGGIHPDYCKGLTDSLPTEEMPPVEHYIVPLSQNLGAPSVPVVEKGAEVARGQKLAEPGGFVSTPVHSPTSGKVTKIDLFPHPLGLPMEAIQIAPDGEDRWADDCGRERDAEAMGADEILETIREAGLVGMGGATFPTHVKLSPPKEKPIDTFIINGAECEPYLTSDHRLMVERGEDILRGGRLMAKVLGAGRVMIGIEENKPDALAMIRELAGEIEVVPLRVTYPQGAEKQLIYALTGRKVPTGGLPMDVGVVVQNVGTAAAAWDACARGIPLIERVVTVTGSRIRTPKNLLVRVGTPLADVVDHCGGLLPGTAKAIVGGPLMGLSQYSLEAPVIKGTSGVVFLGAEEAALFRSEPCIRCGSCVKVCVMGLLPTTINSYAVNEMYDMTEQYNALDCIECGCCAYSCPSRIPLVQNFRRAKAEIQARRKKAS